MKLGTLLNGGLALGALSALWLAPACSGSGGGGGSFVEQACGSICARASKAREALGCSTGMESSCYQDCVRQSLTCSPERLGALSDCIGPLDDSDFVCSGGEAVVSSGCSSQSAAYQASCTSNSGGTGGSGGSSSGGTAGKGGSSGSSSGGVGGSIAGSSGNGGSGGTVTLYCTGSAYPCSYFTDGSCSAQFGCTGALGCTGTTQECVYFDVYGEVACATQLGCYWDPNAQQGLGACLGVPYYCDEIFDSTQCYSQLSCSWADTCAGTAYSCDTLPADVCEQQTGCYLQ